MLLINQLLYHHEGFFHRIGKVGIVFSKHLCLLDFCFSHGHVNTFLGIAHYFEQAGHSIYFAIRNSMKCLVDSYGYNVVNFDVEGENATDDHQKKWGKFISDNCKIFRENSQFIKLLPLFVQEILSYNKLVDDTMYELIQKVKPDLIVYECFIPLASILKSGVPHVNVHSANPLFLWPDANESLNAEFETLFKPVSDWLREKNVESDFSACRQSSLLNVYIYPEDLDYVEKGKLEGKFFRIDHAIRKDTEPLNVDLSFVQPGEKLVYFSLGSMGAADVELMKMLVKILAKSKHKFVVSKGPCHDQIDLASNMVGVKYVNQLKVLPHVDLVITHGGNNTTVETLYFGKPLIVLPMFGDQPRNAERIEEKKLGKHLLPYKVTEEELLTAIDSLLEDEELIQRVAKLGEKLRNSKKGLEMVKFVEKELENKKNHNNSTNEEVVKK